MFHVSCLIHWILLCELETYGKPVDEPKVETKAKRRSKRKTGAKHSAKGKKDEIKPVRRQIYSVFCPECQGTGISIKGDDLEKPTVPLSEVCHQPAICDCSHSTYTSTSLSGTPAHPQPHPPTPKQTHTRKKRRKR